MDWKHILLFFFSGTLLLGQEIGNKHSDSAKELAEMDSIVVGDHAIFDTVKLDDAEILHLNLKTEMEKKYYVWLRKRVRDVWPYVKVAVEEYNFIQDTSQYFDQNRARKKFVKARQKALADRFEKQLKDLSISRGQILIKLIHRETNLTAYEIIKELRGGVNAFMWNVAGGAYDLELKTEFNPKRTREDLYIEVILMKDFQSGRLERIKDFE
ncbi:MAG TPA: DUF4294 domain-containing protein [Moheibacter sp.]|nr:DUF4294 domain-containing protein [Moheibacter sp.]